MRAAEGLAVVRVAVKVEVAKEAVATAAVRAAATVAAATVVVTAEAPASRMRAVQIAIAVKFVRWRGA